MTNTHPEERIFCPRHDCDGFRETISGEVRVAILGGGETAQELATSMMNQDDLVVFAPGPDSPLACPNPHTETIRS